MLDLPGYAALRGRRLLVVEDDYMIADDRDSLQLIRGLAGRSVEGSRR